MIVSPLLVALAVVVGQIGTLMNGPSTGTGGTPGGGFAIITEDSSVLTTESNSAIVTEDAP